MKKSTVLCGLLALFLSINTYAGPPKTCAQKAKEIERKIFYANEHNNNKELARLNFALEKNKEECSDTRLKADREERIRQHTSRVQIAEEELKEAQANGNRKKLLKAQDKLAKEQFKLKKAQED